MVIITSFTIFAARKYGLPIALIALLGSFIIPLFTNRESVQIHILFIYFYALNLGLTYLSRKEGWWILSLISSCFSYLLIFYCLFYFLPSYSIFYSISIYSIAIAFTNLIMSSRINRELQKQNNYIFGNNLISTLGSILIITYIVPLLNYNLMSWLLFGAASIFSLSLFYLNPNQYRYLPFISLVINAATFYYYSSMDNTLLVIILSFAMLYIIGSCILQHLLPNKPEPKLLKSAALIIFYLLFCHEYDNLTESLTPIPFLVNFQNSFFIISAKAIVAFSIAALEHRVLMKFYLLKTSDEKISISISAFTVGIFIFFGINEFFEILSLQKDLLILVIAMQINLIAWLNYKYKIKSFEVLACLLLIYLFIYGFIPFIFFIPDSLAYLTMIKSQIKSETFFSSLNFVSYITSITFIFSASYFLKKDKDSLLVKFTEGTAIIMLLSIEFVIIVSQFGTITNNSFILRGIISNFLLINAFALTYIGAKYHRIIFYYIGYFLSIIASLRIIALDLLAYFPTSNYQEIGETFIFNKLLIVYGLPVLWLQGISLSYKKLGKNNINIYLKVLMLVLSFCLISLNIRQLFHGSILKSDITTNLEIYTYSFIWLLFGILLLGVGVFFNDKMLRYGSLCVLILTIGKVFLYDISNLTDLYLVFSFLALGICLITLGWFYSKFVFKSNRKTIRNPITSS